MVAKTGTGLTAVDGSQYVTLTDGAGNLISGNTGTGSTVTANGADAISNTAINAQNVESFNMLFSGTSWDRVRGLNGASQTATTGMPSTVLIPNSSPLAGIASTATSAAAGSIILKATAGNLFSVCLQAGASAGFFMVFDSATVPADGVVTPVYCVPVAANGFYTTDFAYPIKCTTGITLVFSTTGPFSKTISATAYLAGQFI